MLLDQSSSEEEHMPIEILHGNDEPKREVQSTERAALSVRARTE